MNCIVLGKYYCITFCYCIYCTPQYALYPIPIPMTYNRSKGLYFLYTLYTYVYFSKKETFAEVGTSIFS